MSLSEIIDGARRATREAFEPRHFRARPMYGVGYVPISSLGALGNDEGPEIPPNVKGPAADAARSAIEANHTSTAMAALFGASVVLGAAVEAALYARELRKKKRKAKRARRGTV